MDGADFIALDKLLKKSYFGKSGNTDLFNCENQKNTEKAKRHQKTHNLCSLCG